MATIAVDKDEFVKRCEEVYERKKENLEREYYGKIVALYEGGVGGIGESTNEAYRQAIKEHPGKIFYFRRIGRFSAASILF